VVGGGQHDRETGRVFLIQRGKYLSMGDGRKVIPDPDAKYFGAVQDKDGLAPTGQSLLDRHALLIGHALMLNLLAKRRVTVNKIALLLLAAASLLSTNVAAQETNAPASKVTKIFDRELPNVPGKSMRAVLVEYGPGAASPSHHHPSSAFIYATVLEGEIRSKVNDEAEHVYKAGESWMEMPGDHHKVSANASSTKPARLLAIFVVDTTEQELGIPDK
jgi:quercetin dioxygenase-like cupin family protein